MTKTRTEKTTLQGVVETTFYSGATFTAGRLTTDNGDSVTFAGKVFAKPNDRVALEGRWVEHRKYGRQFAAEGMRHDLPMDPNGLANYLANHPEIKGVGPAKAKLIADRFGTEFDLAIREKPEVVARAAKVPVEVIERLREIWIASSNINAAMTALAAYGLTHHQVMTLIDKYGSGIVAIMERNPYVLVRDLPQFGFKRVDKIARKMGVPKNLPARIKAGLEYCVGAALDEGHCCIDQEELISLANELLVLDDLNSCEVIRDHLGELVAEGVLVARHYDRLVVAEPGIHEMEEYLVRVLRGGAKDNPHREEVIPSKLFHDRLNEEQCRAFKNAFDFSVSLMTGGAGSGKTFAVKVIIDACEDLGLRYEMAAPTGKAAKRLEQVVGRPARTIHRLLGYNGHEYSKGPGNPIDTDMLVIDEVSMVDVPLAWRLFQAIDLTRTAVVLVGDHNQLPPIGPGNLLRDLVQTRAVPTTILTKVIRQAGVLKENSIAILDGEVRPTTEVKIGVRRPWYVVGRFTESSDVRQMLLLLFEEVLRDRLGFDLLRDVQVLTPTHKGPLGTLELNIALQRVLQRKLFGFDVPTLEGEKRPKLYPNDKVIQTKNDYDREVMNGAVGVVLEADEKRGVTVDFEGKEVNFDAPSGDVASLRLAYATSVHKMQGSEFPCAVVVAHRSHSFMHHRNLLYTAVTRARESVIILGDQWGIANCARKQHVDRRNTALSYLLTKTN